MSDSGSYPFPNVQVHWYRGSVEGETGRGMPGTAAEVLSYVDPEGDPLPASSPVPRVVIESVSVSNVGLNSNKRFVADIAVAGYVTFAFADIIPNNEADPTQAVLIVGEAEVATLTLTRSAETPTFLRPYAAKYMFSTTQTAVPILPHQCGVMVKVEDGVCGNIGTDTWAFPMSAVNAPETADDDEPPLPSIVTLGLRQPLLVQLEFSTPLALPVTSPPLDDTITIRARRTYAPEEPEEWSAH